MYGRPGRGFLLAIVILCTLKCSAGRTGDRPEGDASGPLCVPEHENCGAPCVSRVDCDALGGYDCLYESDPDRVSSTSEALEAGKVDESADGSVDLGNGGTPHVHASESPRDGSAGDASPPVSRPSRDAAADADVHEGGVSKRDAAPDAARPPTRQSTQNGYCALKCRTDLCFNASDVCTAPEGFCHPGCDETKPDCPGDQVCDYKHERCVSRDGKCENDLDCSLVDDRLAALVTVACVGGACELTTKPGPVAVSPPLDGNVKPAAVSRPHEGERIDVATLDRYHFVFQVGADVAVAAILTSAPQGRLEDAFPSAIWVAYLVSSDTRNGVLLSQGGSVNGANAVTTFVDTTLYFATFGFTGGLLRTQSRAVPFSIGAPYLGPGATCELPDDALCPSNQPLICWQNTCLAACASDLDCVAVGGYCAEPGYRGITSGVCR